MIEKIIWRIKFNRFALKYEIKSKILEVKIAISRVVDNIYRKIY